MILKRVGVLSVGKVSAVMYGIIGLLAGILFAFVSLIGSTFGANFGESGGPLIGMIFGVGAVITMPLFYGVMGFVGGIIMAALYNLSVKVLGGVEVEMEESVSPMATGTAPQG